MRLRQFYLLLSLIGMALPAILIFNAMNLVEWDWQVARRDLDAFLISVFGQVVLSGYFLAGLSLTSFLIYEAHARSDYYLYWAVPILLVFGIGAALPFYLYLRMPRRE